MEGKIFNKRKPVHYHIVRVKPIAHHYENKGEPEYIKYSCPVCEAVGDKHQVHQCENNCSICGVNLLWNNNEDEEE